MLNYVAHVWGVWQGNGSPAAASQQLFFIVLTTIATFVAVRNLSTWRRQQQATLRAAVIGEVVQDIVLVCDHIIVERIRPEPMVWFNHIDPKPDFDWYEKARRKIENELACWTRRSDELNSRLGALRLSAQKALHILKRDFDAEFALLMIHVTKYQDAVKKREAVLNGCNRSPSVGEYRKLIGLEQLLRDNPILCFHKENERSLEFDEEIKRARQNFRKEVTKFY